MDWRDLAAVGVGGMLGTGLRLAIDVAVPHGQAELPIATLLVNVVGSFVLALLVARAWTRAGVPRWLRVGLGAGVLGSFTTFSAVAASLVAMGRESEWMLAAAYLAGSVILGFGAAVLGLRTGRPPAPMGVEE